MSFLNKTKGFGSYFWCNRILVFSYNSVMVSVDFSELFQNLNLKFMISNFFTQDDWVYDLILNQ